MLAEYLRRTKQKCWKMIAREYPEEKDKRALLSDLVGLSLKSGSVVLDAGCGRRSSIPGHNGLRVVKLGMDLIPEDLRSNSGIDFGFCADMSHIPLADESADMVVCNMVFEHLERPGQAFAELSRILKKGGHLVFMTPCVYNVVTAANRLVPNRFHGKLGKLLTGVNESDVFPTFYRANSVGRLRRLLGRNNLEERDLIMYQPPPFAFVFSTLACSLAIRYYRTINKYRRLEFLRGVIIMRFRKRGNHENAA